MKITKQRENSSIEVLNAEEHMLQFIAQSTMLTPQERENLKLMGFSQAQKKSRLCDKAAEKEKNKKRFLSQFNTDSDFSIDDNLTQKEKEVLELLKRGFSYEECARELVLSQTTVKTHINNLFQKKQVNSHQQLLINEFNPQKTEAFVIHPELTAQEVKILNLLKKGFSYKECENTLSNSKNTIKTQMNHMFLKMEVNSLAQLIAKEFNPQNFLRGTN